MEKYNYYKAKPLIIPYAFSYGYAITTWKAQGSQYQNVLAYDCSWLKRKDKDEYIKYLYTSVTRAVDRIILVGD
jgi:exodeoxyribonuclease-5